MKIFTLPSGQKIDAVAQFQIGDQRYPAGWLNTASDAEIAGAGISIEIVPDPEPEPPAPAPKPTIVTARQARLALLGAGLLDQVNAAVDAAGPAAKIEWEFATTVDRNWPLLLQLASALDLTADQIDELFETAAAL